MTANRPALLMVANYEPGVGFAWWLMEHFWVMSSEIARDNGWDAILAYPEAGRIPRSILRAPIFVQYLPVPGRSLGEFLKFLVAVRRLRISAVYFTDRPFTSSWYLILRLLGVRKILVHDHSPGDRPPVRGIKGAVKALWRRMPLLSADYMIAVSPLVAERAVANARIPRHRLRVVQNGIAPKEHTGRNQELLQDLGIPSDANVCITVARAHAYKRIDHVVEIARRLLMSTQSKPTYFLHCGDGPDLSRLKELVSAANLQDYFKFLGVRNDVHELLCSADVAVHPSAGEAFSLAILEYMRAGLPLLVPDIPSVCQAIENGVDGLIYADGDFDEAAELLRDLLEHPSMKMSIGAAARDKVYSRYSQEAMDREFCKLMSATLGN